MVKLILTDIFLLCGLCVTFYGAYQLIRQRGGRRNVIWLVAGLITVVGTILDSTVLVYFARAGHEQSTFFLHNVINAIMVSTWLYVAYKEGFFKSVL